MKEYGLYIGGEWANSSSGKTFESRNPANGKVVGVFQEGNREDVLRAVDAAEKAFPSWKRFPPPKKGEILLRAASILRERKNEIGALVTREMGKVIAEGKGDVQEAIDFLEYIAAEGRRLMGETVPSELPDKICLTLRQPIGVVGCITPWNFPTAIPCWKLGAALISGNTIVFKPATLTPMCAATLVEILGEAGVPPGVLNMVTGPASSVGEEIVQNSRIRSISFTGSVETGKEVYSKASRLLKRVGLELGGKNPQIVMEDANIDLAVEGVLFGAFGTAGQRCTATSRLIVQESVYEEVKEKLLSRTEALKVGDPIDPEMHVGPVISASQEDKVLNYIQIGLDEGAKLLCGGRKLTGSTYDDGFFIAPTIFEARHGQIQEAL